MPSCDRIFDLHQTKFFPMKRIFLFLVLAMGVVLTHAGTLTVMSFSPCSYFVNIAEGNGSLYVTNGFYNVYPDPSTVPGSTAPSTASFTGAAIRRDNFPDGFGVGTPPLGVIHRSSSDINDYPACNSGLAYDVYWNINPMSGDIILLII